MISSIKQKLASAQQEIGTSLSTLTSVPTGSFVKSGKYADFNPDAGGELLSLYQDHWAQIHNESETCAKKAEEVDKQTQNLSEKYSSEARTVTEMNALLMGIPELALQIDAIDTLLVSLEESFKDVEAAMSELEYLQAELDRKDSIQQLVHSVATFRQQRLIDLDKLRANLAVQHAKKVTEYERKNVSLRKEKEKVFEDEFLKEIEEYRQSGRINREAAQVPLMDSPKLEDVSVGTEAESEVLEEFLRDMPDTMEQTPNVDDIISEETVEAARDRTDYHEL